MSNPDNRPAGSNSLPCCELIDHAVAQIEKRRRLNERSSVLFLANADDATTQGVLTRLKAAGAQVTQACRTPIQAAPDQVSLAEAITDGDHQAKQPGVNAPPLPGEPYDMVLALRALNHLPYEQARAALRRLLFRLRIGGKLYLAMYGIHSELGDDYADGDRLVTQRHCPLAPEIAARYHIDGPICLYSERNIFSLLLEAGAAVIHTSSSALGHVRGIANRV